MLKLKGVLAALCGVVIAFSSASAALAAPYDDYFNSVNSWVSSTVDDIIGGASGEIQDEQGSGDYGGDSSDGYYRDSGSEDSGGESEDATYEPESDYYDEPAEAPTEPETAQENSQDDGGWFDWFAVSQDETEPETETALESESGTSTGTTEYVGYGFIMWIVIIVGVILTITIITNTHLRKKS